MYMANLKADEIEIDPDVISRLLSRYVTELQGHGLSDHRWLLFALDDIASYCGENGFDNARHAIFSVLQSIDADIVCGTLESATVH